MWTGWFKNQRGTPRPVRKTPREYELMKVAGRITGDCHAMLAGMIVPGITTGAINRAVEEFIRAAGAAPAFKGLYGFPASACVSVNEEIVHGIPTDERVLREGDIVTVDVGVRHRNFHGDAAWTYAVGALGPAAERLLAAGRRALELAVAACQPFVKLKAVSRAVQEYAEGLGYSVVRDYVGHGIGFDLHEDPKVPNFIDDKLPDLQVDLRPGMAICVEPMLNEGAWKTEKLADRWTVVTADRKLSVHFEHTVFIHDVGGEVLTPHPLWTGGKGVDAGGGG
ncbi:MAG: type I methionyl aminopeptidase [Planctomycetes bacterium]|nr:type I methionyl aminopeptidase [Planctomycetota bacterium]